MIPINTSLRALIWALLLTLFGCGGCGDDVPEPDPEPDPVYCGPEEFGSKCWSSTILVKCAAVVEVIECAECTVHGPEQSNVSCLVKFDQEVTK